MEIVGDAALGLGHPGVIGVPLGGHDAHPVSPGEVFFQLFLVAVPPFFPFLGLHFPCGYL